MISIIYVTNRRVCLIQLFFDSLHRELNGDYTDVEVIVISPFADELRAAYESDSRIPRIVFAFPKPSVWSGPNRKTKRDYWSASSFRNTGLCLASGEMLCYVDDLSILMPGFWSQILLAKAGNFVSCGAYRKVFELQAENGLITRCVDNPAGHDSRLKQVTSEETLPCYDSWVFGCSLAIPTEWLLAINGWDEGLDAQSGEDSILGVMLKRNGYDIRFAPRQLTYESSEHHADAVPALRIIKPYPGYKDSSWAILDWAQRGNRTASPNFQNMRELRQKILAGEPFPIPTEPSTHWRDNAPLSTM